MAGVVGRQNRFKGGKDAVDDLVMLDQIKEERVLETLRNRYAADQIYTNIGPVLIAINPFKMIPELFTAARIREYKGKKFFELPPHVFALADDAYRKMTGYKENQCIIISGESGSGKTETSKLIMQYISNVSGRGAEVQRVKDRMLSSNPLLEAFGNAKTVNNNNSSRFGKYMEILFDMGGDPVGGRVTNYLLEKSRVVNPALGERNFHAFYQMCNGMSQQEKEQYCVYAPEYYWYLSQSECYQVPGIDDQSDWKEMNNAIQVMGMGPTERSDLMRILSAVLWLGNITFTEDKQEKSAVENTQVLDIVASLLAVEAKDLEVALTTREIQTGVGNKAEIFTKPLTAEQAAFSRDTLAKALYSRMFDYLVHKINESMKKDNFVGIMIGVLDIYGFEIFQFNSFEQLCINFVNERLQQIFIELTLKAEQEEYATEGIPWTDVEYNNNKPLCDLIENKPGLLSICDDCCHTAKTDQMFVQDLSRFFQGNPHIFCGQNDFSIRHYAGDVRYEAANFLTKNKDTLFDDLIIVMQKSKCQFVQDHGWATIEVQKGQKQRPPTVGSTFKRQVEKLMASLMACVPHYIRCIKPNAEKAPNKFDMANIKRQVQYLGLMENIRVRRAGYAYRSIFIRFTQRYKLLSRDLWAGRSSYDDRQDCHKLLHDVGFKEGQEYAMGKTKIFIRAATSLFQLEDMLDRRMNEAVVIIQKAWRKYKQKRYYLEMRAKAYDVVAGKKERRRGSVDRDYRGDYLDFTYNNMVNALLQTAVVGKKERVLFADRVKVALLRGKKSLLNAIVSAFKTEELIEQRFCLLSDEALYSFVFHFDPETRQTRIKLYFRVSISFIQSITMSPFSDNFFVIHFAPGANTTDVLQSCRRKTEFVGLVNNNYQKKTGRALSVQFLQQDSIALKENKMVLINFFKDEMVPLEEDNITLVKHNVEIRSPSGVPPNMVKEPFRPPEHDMSVPARPALTALYAYQGNGVDELSFKPGDVIFIVAEEEGGWYTGELNGKQGYVPSNHVERIKRKAPANIKSQGPVRGGAAKKSAWQELKTDTGDVYYYNEQTGASQWELPLELKQERENPAPPSQPAPPASSAPRPTMPERPIVQPKTCSHPGCGNNTFGGKEFCISHVPKQKHQEEKKAPAPAMNRPVSGGAGAASPGARPMSGGAMPAPVMNRAVSAGGVGGRTGPALPARPGMGSPGAAAPMGGMGRAASPGVSPQPGRMAMPGMGAGRAAASPSPAANPMAGRGGGMYGGAAPAAGGGGMYGGGAGRGGPAVGRAPMQAPVKPSSPPPQANPWQAVVDPGSGHTYYYNSATGATQWEKPAGM